MCVFIKRSVLLYAFIILISLHSYCYSSNSFKIKNRKINAILYPSIGLPVIVQAGSDFESIVSNRHFQGLKKVWLSPISSASPSQNLPLNFTVVTSTGSTTTYRIKIPQELQEGLFDLSIESEEGHTDTQPHSVKVTYEFKKDFSFVIIADIHFGDTRGEIFAPGENFDALRKNILMAASKKEPEFILLVGDITNLPNTYTKDYEQAWDYFKNYCSAPLYLIPGNHDSYRIRKSKDVFIDGKQYWEAIFGPLYYYFDYGEMRFVGIDNYDWQEKYRNLGNLRLMTETDSINTGNIGQVQFDWLKEVFKTAKKKTIVPFAHLPFDEIKSGTKGKEGTENPPGVPEGEILQLFQEYGIKYIFIGHWHRNETKNLDGIKQVMTNTSGSDLYSEERWGFNTVYVKDWEIDHIEFTVVGFH